METVSLNLFADLFGTVAQVSFGIAGLFFVALTINEQRRTRWFDKENFSFVGFSFVMIVLPGFISLVGLIPSMSLLFLSLFALLLYGTVLIGWWAKIRMTVGARAERSKWKWLQTIWDIKGDAILFIIIWLFCIFAPSSIALLLMGLVLVASIVASTIATFTLFLNK